MPTITGAIWAQNVGFRVVTGGETADHVTLRLNNRDISADAAICQVLPTDLDIGLDVKPFRVLCGFSSFVSNGSLRSFNLPWPNRLVEFNVTELTFSTLVLNCASTTRWVINFWE